MLHGWTNLILHTTSRIQGKKQALLTDHALKSVLDVFGIIVLEVFLLVISLPLYLVTKPMVGAEENVQYKTRRILSLTVLGAIFVLWLFKLLLILWASFFSGQNAYEIGALQPSQESALEYVNYQASTWKEDATLSAPVITEVASDEDENVYFKGSSTPNTVVAIYLSDVEANGQSSLKLYSVRSDENGQWEMLHEERIYHMTAGEYWVQAVAYDELSSSKSPASAPVAFELQKPLEDMLLENVDRVLNLVILLFAFLGFLSALLTL